MSDIAIKVENLGKSYLVGHNAAQSERYTALRDVIAHNAKNLARKTRDMLAGRPIVQGDEVEEFWALKDVSFEIKQGDRVGIIGRNGAGKSTLLKILSRITEPTTGRIALNGRVASLLEVGTGFHPELSGRENIFLNGAILGMSRKEIQFRFDEIVAFSEVEKFLDTPVKRYSSGMYVRLAFAVAAHLEPEILIVDEVLAVGDVQFQKKCLGKMESVANEGRTVLFVSHNLSAVEQLTNISILLDRGTNRTIGSTSEVVAEYLNRNNASSDLLFDVATARREYIGNGKAQFLQLAFNRETPTFSSDEDFVFLAKIIAHASMNGVRLSLTIFSADGNPVGSCFAPPSLTIESGRTHDVEVRLPCPRLAPGSYYCGLSVGTGNHLTGLNDYDVVLNTLHFDVRPPEGDGATVSVWPRGWGNIVFDPLRLFETTPVVKKIV